ncbi:protein of unknown function DUF448 [Beutenbergia cavernae DSM 12333]|uniref:YlxR domain-containing protein n=1 Tax=Beutenbergia cavernae (strain ATCC BAA-8 / DSM 12333 / CCUG 43141 / JCM 11478 / NBRC 16432 / NCIMB 13614 / HKI 0122) TaxID=471853 RepID=C5BWS4_BEUC1|nr:protein of unknown function DUF448 [Beutenbergia cavernae DSM 12333]
MTRHPRTSDDAAVPETHGPVRTCVGCRVRDLRSALVRVVVTSTAGITREHPVAVVDERRTAPGRGAWLHPQPECLDRAERRGAIGRALRLAGPVDTSEVRTWFSRTGGPVIERESGLEADGHPMSTQR